MHILNVVVFTRIVDQNVEFHFDSRISEPRATNLIDVRCLRASLFVLSLNCLWPVFVCIVDCFSISFDLLLLLLVGDEMEFFFFLVSIDNFFNYVFSLKSILDEICVLVFKFLLCIHYLVVFCVDICIGGIDTMMRTRCTVRTYAYWLSDFSVLLSPHTTKGQHCTWMIMFDC